MISKLQGYCPQCMQVTYTFMGQHDMIIPTMHIGDLHRCPLCDGPCKKSTHEITKVFLVKKFFGIKEKSIIDEIEGIYCNINKILLIYDVWALTESEKCPLCKTDLVWPSLEEDRIKKWG